MKTNIKGAGVALVTPFTEQGKIDFSALGNLVEHVIAGGVDYLVALGTTAETPTLTCEEQHEVARFIRERNNGRLPLVIGIGGNNTAAIVDNVAKFDFSGFEALLSVTPYYNKPSQQGLYEHYKLIAQASSVPVILYNVPGRTGVNLAAETTLRLAHECKNITAVKEACGNLSQVAYILRDRPEGFLVLSGDDNMCFPIMNLGGDGIISVLANAYPRPVVDMVRSIQAGNLREAASHMHLQLLEFVDALFSEGNPAGIKVALSNMGLIQNVLRSPLVAGSTQLCERLKLLSNQYNLK